MDSAENSPFLPSKGDSYGGLQKRSNNGAGGMTTTSYDSQEIQSTFSGESDSGIPIPLILRPFIKRLEDHDELDDADIMNIVFIVRVADAMLQAGYATFLTRSFVEELKNKLRIPDLDLEIELTATRWSYQQGAVMTYHPYASNFDGYEMQTLSRITLGVIHGNLDVKEGLIRIDACCQDRKGMWKLEHFYRDFPGRVLVGGIVSSMGSVLFFGGTWYDMAICAVTGCVAGMVQYVCSCYPQLSGVEETLVAVLSALMASISVYFLPGSVCLPAQVLGTLLNNLYGISFVLSLYEITQNLVMTGLARFCIATLKTFVLAFGVVLGVWMARWGGPDRLQESVAPEACENLMHTVDHNWFNFLYPILSAGALMQLQVSMKHWPVCLLTQFVAVQLQYVLSRRLEQPVFVANFIPAFVAAITADFFLVVSHKLGLTQMQVDKKAFLAKKLKPKKDFKERLAPKSQRNLMTASTMDMMRYVDHGWAAGGDGRDTRQRGYRRNNRYMYQRGDLWFCLLPTVYLLVPGAMIWRLAFFSIVNSSSATTGPDDAANMYNFQNLASGVLVVGIGLVVGFRFGFATIWACNTIWAKILAAFQPTTTDDNNSDEDVSLDFPVKKVRPSLLGGAP